MKTHTKKKRFQAFCQSQAMKGLINDATGNWITASGKAIDQMYLNGYRINKRRSK